MSRVLAAMGSDARAGSPVSTLGRAAARPRAETADASLDRLRPCCGAGTVARSVHQRSLNAIDKATAAKLVATRIQEGAVVSGLRRRDAWRVVRRTSR